MTRPLTFGDTFTLPSTGDDVWTIRDVRPTSYLPPEDLTLPGRETVARAESRHRGARYAVDTGWTMYGAPADGEQILAELNALPVTLGHRTDLEWRRLHLAHLAEEVRWALRDVVGTGPGFAPTHPLFEDAELIAHITATAAEVAAGRETATLYDPLYFATLERLRS